MQSLLGPRDSLASDVHGFEIFLLNNIRKKYQLPG